MTLNLLEFKLLKLPLLIGLAVTALAQSAAAADVSVIQKDQAFSQPSITIQPGDTVMWGNADDVDHNITVKGGDVATDFGVQKPGHVIKRLFDATGAYRVICHIHPKMKMTVIVQ